MELTQVFKKYIHTILPLLFPLLLQSQTFNGVGNLAFPPSGTTGVTQSTCGVSGVGILGGCNTIANVTIDLDHTWTGDIALMLIAPDGTFIELSSGNGSAGNNFTNTVFTDAASTNITAGSPPFTGQFKPEGRQNTTLTNPYPNTGTPGTFTFQNTFTGVDADGAWILYLNDYVAGDIGFLNSWSMTFSNAGPGFTVNLGPDQTICAGQNISLTATNTAPSPTGYLWSNGSTSQTTTISNLTSSTTYTVTVTDQSGCTGTDAITVNVSAAPTAKQTLQHSKVEIQLSMPQ
ncbi:MAG: proprotein convertase P-domain-containing protein [Saprospiraceae bacterium]|nr:proprotein convertase P-domain-containing protein [Saprospiraceae bacterium]